LLSGLARQAIVYVGFIHSPLKPFLDNSWETSGCLVLSWSAPDVFPFPIDVSRVRYPGIEQSNAGLVVRAIDKGQTSIEVLGSSELTFDHHFAVPVAIAPLAADFYSRQSQVPARENGTI
jgi:hypothetical protein